MASSAARAKPTREGTNSDEPPSGTSPMLTKASEKYADSAATTRSQASARDMPIPAAGDQRVIPLGQLLVHVERAASLARVLQVGAAGEGPPGAGDQDRPDLRVVGDLPDRREQVDRELVVPRVHPLAAVEVDCLILAVKLIVAHAGHVIAGGFWPRTGVAAGAGWLAGRGRYRPFG